MRKKEKTTVVSREIAVTELNKWFDELQVPEELRVDVDLPEDFEDSEDYDIEKREKEDVMRERVIRAISNGTLILNSDSQLELTLKTPLTKKESSEIVLDKLIFKSRYRSFELESNMKGVRPDEFMPMTRS